MRNSKTKRIRICALLMGRILTQDSSVAVATGSLLHWNQGGAVVPCKGCAAVDSEHGRNRRNRGPELWGYVLASGRLPLLSNCRFYQEVLNLGAEVRSRQVGGEDSSTRASPVGWRDLRREP